MLSWMYNACIFSTLSLYTLFSVTCTVLEIVFESVQKYLDKTIFDQRVVNFIRKKKAHKLAVYGL